jgi:hypothetical protein
LYKIWHIGKEQTVTLTLPAVSADNVGSWIRIRKDGTGILKIRTDTGDIIRCSRGSGNQFENSSSETYATLFLILESANEWILDGTPTGAWDLVTV